MKGRRWIMSGWLLDLSTSLRSLSLPLTTKSESDLADADELNWRRATRIEGTPAAVLLWAIDREAVLAAMVESERREAIVSSDTVDCDASVVVLVVE